MSTIGILALQGAFSEHAHMIQKLGHFAREVRLPKDLEGIDALILPGGESTTISKLLDSTGLRGPITDLLKNGLPCMGTCAGMILLAKTLTSNTVQTLGVMNIEVMRNAFGRQVDSFSRSDIVDKLSPKPIPLIFIRAPIVVNVDQSVEILHQVNERIVAVREDHLLALSFHPELTEDLTFHKYFIKMIK